MPDRTASAGPGPGKGAKRYPTPGQLRQDKTRIGGIRMDDFNQNEMYPTTTAPARDLVADGALVFLFLLLLIFLLAWL